MIPWEWLILSGWKSENQDSVPDRLWRSLIAGRDAEGKKPGPYYRQGCLLAIRNRNRNGDVLTTDLIRHGSPAMMVDFLRRTQDVMWNRTLFLPTARAEPTTNLDPSHDASTTNSRLFPNADRPTNPEGVTRTEPRLGVGPKNARVGDIICILYGCSVPVVLRRLRSTSHPERSPSSLPAAVGTNEVREDASAYKLIGEAFMLDLMDGEGLISRRAPDKWFRLI